MYVQSTSIYDTASESFSSYICMYECMYIQVRKSAPDQDAHKDVAVVVMQYMICTDTDVLFVS